LDCSLPDYIIIQFYGGHQYSDACCFHLHGRSKTHGSFKLKTTTFWDVMPCASVFRVQVKLKLPSQQSVINIFWNVLPCASNFREELIPKVPSKYWNPSTRIWWCHNPEEHNPNLYCHKNLILTPVFEGNGQGWFHKPSLPQTLALNKKTIIRSTLLGDISRRPKYEIQGRICIHVFVFQSCYRSEKLTKGIWKNFPEFVLQLMAETRMTITLKWDTCVCN
jgi:hypothetical protein